MILGETGHSGRTDRQTTPLSDIGAKGAFQNVSIDCDCQKIFHLGPVSARDNRVFNGPLGRSVRGLNHSLRSLPHGTVEIHESVFTL